MSFEQHSSVCFFEQSLTAAQTQIEHNCHIHVSTNGIGVAVSAHTQVQYWCIPINNNKPSYSI